jgi:hypothetical protein
MDLQEEADFRISLVLLNKPCHRLQNRADLCPYGIELGWLILFILQLLIKASYFTWLVKICGLFSSRNMGYRFNR